MTFRIIFKHLWKKWETLIKFQITLKLEHFESRKLTNDQILQDCLVSVGDWLIRN